MRLMAVATQSGRVSPAERNAAIASSFEGPDGTEQAARYARAALSSVGDRPSRVRYRALRALAAARIRQGQADAALGLLEMAITQRYTHLAPRAVRRDDDLRPAEPRAARAAAWGGTVMASRTTRTRRSGFRVKGLPEFGYSERRKATRSECSCLLRLRLKRSS